MRNYIITILLIATQILSQSVIAGQINAAKIKAIIMDDLGLVRLSLVEGTVISAQASCAQSSNYQEFIFDINAPSGNGWHAMALSAQAMQASVNIVGSGLCKLQWGSRSTESVSTIYVVK